MVEIPGGVYPIGDDEPVLYSGQEYRSHVPRHSVAVEAFAIGQYPVTNAEYACFMADGGYAEERWWDTPDGRAWRSGEGTASGPSGNVWFWWRRFGEHPEQLDAMYQDGALGQELYERWQWRLTMDEAELAAHLRAIYPDGRRAEPSEWHNPRFNNPAQPVVGVSWYEARAYCAWLAAATSMPFRLPAEVEWEAAARGLAGRRYPHGESVDALPGNTSETRLMRTAPVGVFVDGATPEGVQDLMGNVMEWTSSLFGPQDDEALFGYPYKASDGREDTLAGIDMRRVARGGDWFDNRLRAVCSSRGSCTPNRRNAVGGFRVARASAGTS
jgi:formylglycine-generating enzyme required for sulfatase activity